MIRIVYNKLIHFLLLTRTFTHLNPPFASVPRVYLFCDADVIQRKKACHRCKSIHILLHIIFEGATYLSYLSLLRQMSQTLWYIFLSMHTILTLIYIQFLFIIQIYLNESNRIWVNLFA